MREPVEARQLRELARALARVARRPVRVYLTGGSTAVLEGWRSSTIDIDLRLEPEADELLRELPALKERLEVNVELASPTARGRLRTASLASPVELRRTAR